METSNKLIGEPLSAPTLFAVDTLASHLVPPANDEAPTTHDTCGLGLEKPLAHYDPDTRSWKTLKDICLWGEPQSLESLPKSGMTRNGELFQQPAWVRPIDATDSSLWPTPTAVTRPMEGNVRLYRAKIKAGEMTETEANAILGKSVWEAQGKIPAMWPTPTTQEVEHYDMELTEAGRRKSKDGKSSHSLGLADAVRLNSPDNGKLNPTWVEWLMGFPLGWTDLKD
jgi:hypothetical protein